MGADTKGYLRANVVASDIFNVITTKFDKDAKFDIRNDSDGEIGSVYFKYNDEDRGLFYCVSSRDPEDNRVLFDGDQKYVALVLGYWGNSAHIMTEIVNEFGGYVDENDCDDIDAVYIEKDGETSYSEYVYERNKIVAVLDENLNDAAKYQVAAQILKHRDKLKEVL